MSLSGKELEQKLNIPQQYRSRTDAQFANFISKSEQSPRTYTDKDVLAYEVIFQARDEKLTRPAIMTKLAQLAKVGQLDFYASEIHPTIDTILDYQPGSQPVKSNGMPRTRPEEDKPKPVKRNRISKGGYELAEEIGKVKAIIEMMQEEMSEKDLLIASLQKEVEELRNKPTGWKTGNDVTSRLDAIETKLDVIGQPRQEVKRGCLGGLLGWLGL